MSIYPTIYSKANPLAHASQVLASLSFPFPNLEGKKPFFLLLYPAQKIITINA
jgi:hypothetical protein